MLYCFSYAPVQLYDKYKKWRPYSRTKTEVFFLVFGDFISINFIILGVLFKLQHWPFADKMITYGSLSLIILLLLWNSRLKKEIILRKEREDALKEKKQEILDSITYAKRLQDAILPPNKLVSAYLLESFIIYKPKDIVAGDFYFMDVVEDSDSNRNGKKRVYYVAADCTGHGVPGAMVSIVGANGLKRCIQEFGLRDPGKILDKLAQLVAENFSQSEEKIRDGMDLALCCLEIENSKTVRVHYAGANNPLWVINNNRQNIPASAIEFKEGGGFEIKANKQAIGYTENITSFTTHVFDVEEGDKLYTFSDGYPDQFGGKLGKKYKSANFRRFLLSIEDKDMDEQKKLVDEEFENWKGELEQVDDVCVIGVRL
jgi:serine phosphatase RsbU (regulator of sigma subunit)